MIQRLSLAVAFAVLLPPAMAPAHPHAFLDTEMRLVVEDGALVRIELTWTYDAFTTMFLLEDRGLDGDGDGELGPDELEALRGFDVTDWTEDFAGDLFLEANGAPVTLGDPVATGIAVTDGRIVASHARSVDAIPVEAVTIRQYDPTFYIAYTLQPDIAVSDGCTARIDPHDPDAATETLESELSRVPEDQFEVMQVGHLFADTVTLSCARSS